MPPKQLQRVLLDSIDPTVFAELIKSINPEITPNNTRLTLIPDAELSNKLFYFASKSRIYQSKPLQLATGILTLNHDDKHLSTIYSIATLSNEDSAVSILIGYGFEGKKIGGEPLVILGAARRLGRRSYFLGEIPMDGDEVFFPLLGIRRYSEDGLSVWGYTFPYLINYSFSFGIS